MGADASADAVRALAVKLGLDQPLAVRYLQWIERHARRRSRQQLCLRHAGREPDRGAAGADRSAGDDGDADHGGAGAGGRHLRRRQPQQARRRRRDGADAGRHRDAEFLVRDPADPAVLGAAAMVLGRRLSRLGRRHLARHQVAAAAGDLAGGGAGGDPRAHHALGGARSAARGLRAHRARQGPRHSARCCGATCCATP